MIRVRILHRIRNILQVAQLKLDKWKPQAPAPMPQQLPTAEGTRCFRCNNRLSHPHFSCEPNPKAFCMWYCANAYHLIRKCGVYKIEKGEVVIVEDAGAKLQIDVVTKRPISHPIRD